MHPTIIYRRHRLSLLRALKATIEEQISAGIYEDSHELAHLRNTAREVTHAANRAHAALMDAEWRIREQSLWLPTTTVDFRTDDHDPVTAGEPPG